MRKCPNIFRDSLDASKTGEMNAGTRNDIKSCPEIVSMKKYSIELRKPHFFQAILILCVVNAYGSFESLKQSNSFSTDQLVSDWEDQDRIADRGYQSACSVILENTQSISADLRLEYETLSQSDASNSQWNTLYLELCAARRKERLSSYMNKIHELLFLKHKVDGRRYFANKRKTQREGFHILEIDQNTVCREKHIDIGHSKVLDPNLSFDGKKILFADKDGLFEYERASGETRRITEGHTDMHGIYLPDGNILFSSKRTPVIIPCNGSGAANFYLCDKDGNYIRRIHFDQANVYFPSLLPDGRVIFTRWGYVDRTRWHTFDLFTMNPDGSNLLGYYGNASCFPPFLAYPKAIPGTNKVLTVLTGKNNGGIAGPLAVIDVAAGDEGTDGLEFFGTQTEPEVYCGDEYRPDIEVRYAYPLPLSDTACLASGSAGPTEKNRFFLYTVLKDGSRELLAADTDQGIGQTIPLKAPGTYPLIPSKSDYTRQTADCYITNVNIGRGTEGVAPGVIEKVRVVEIDYAITDVGQTDVPGTGFHSPAALMGGSWCVKKVLGEAPVEDDGSVAFEVPARTPVYFQAIDAEGKVVQTMREWVTFMPGESASCFGCHESKHSTPPTGQPIARTPNPLDPFDGKPARWFSFTKEIQPILNDNCTRCHDGTLYEGKKIPNLTADSVLIGPIHWTKGYMSLVEYGKDPECETRDRNKTSGTCESGTLQFDSSSLTVFYGYDDSPEVLPPYYAGAARSKLVTMLENKHSDVVLTDEEIRRISCWIDLAVPYLGTWDEHLVPESKEKYDKAMAAKLTWEEIERQNIADLAGVSTSTRYADRHRGKTHRQAPMKRRPYATDPRAVTEWYDFSGRRVKQDVGGASHQSPTTAKGLLIKRVRRNNSAGDEIYRHVFVTE